MMRYFITGASGWIGGATAAALIAAGHEVTGLARSDESARALESAGVTPLRGELRDLDVLARGAAASDGVVHLGFIHDFSDFAAAGRVEHAAVTALGDALAGSDRPLIVASGMAGAVSGRPLVETDVSPMVGIDSPRGGSENLALGYAGRGVRAMAVRFAPTVHGAGDHGFTAELVRVARATGTAAYIGDGVNAWAAVHRTDAAAVVCGALEQGAAGERFHAAAEEGIATRDIAAAIGAGLGLPVTSVTTEDAAGHFGWIARFFATDMPASSVLTRERLGWAPTGPTLLDDLQAGRYFD
jgi:nucleoside-diphosphate-sugar epimerase